MFILGLCVLITTAIQVQGICTEDCNEPTLLYEDLQCKPVYASSDDCCPCHFDCSHIEARSKSDAEICYFHGKTYKPGESLNDDDIYGNCHVGCTCNKKESGNMGFTCAVLDCPEVSGVELEPGCRFKYEVGKCCSVGQVCEPFNVKCEVGGKTYYDGQEFEFPNTKCTECVCQSGFAGKYEEPFCKKRTCIEEVGHQREIKSFCAPSYISKEDCCPFGWICPIDDDTIVPSKNPSKHSDLKCKFGNLTLGIGDTFSRISENEGRLTCECVIPPYLTCIQNYEYPVYSLENIYL